MTSNELNNIISTLNEQGKMHYVEAATEEQITEFEENNSLTLPARFKEWLLFSDGGEFFLPAGIQLYGVSHKPMIDCSESDRPDDDYIVIGATSWGDPVLFKKGSDQISIYNHADGRIEEDESYTDFFVFLNGLYEMLSDEEE